MLGRDSVGCVACGRDNPSGSRFCNACGAGLETPCGTCGESNPSGARFCNGCGAQLSAAASAPPSPARAPDRHAYTPKHLAEKILTSRAALEGERKQVTVLFADVKGSMELAEQVDAEEWHRIMDRFFAILTDGVHRFEGTVNQYTGDGIMALFGAPIAHEDHAQRACYAALRLTEELRGYANELRSRRGLNFSVRMGLNSGEVVVGTIGDDLRMDYTAQGHTVGLAARMEQLAEPGKAYLSEHTARLVEGLFRLGDLGLFTVKGVHDPVRVYELQDVGPLRTRLEVAAYRGLSRFVGRREQLEQLGRAWEAARAGHGQIVAVMGEAGVGKSRLFHEFKVPLQTQCRVLETFSVSHGKAHAYLPVIDLLRTYFNIGLEDDERARREKVTGKVLALDRTLEDTLAYVFALLGMADPTSGLSQMDSQIRRRRTLEAVKRILLRETLDQPLTLICEDLHWFDGESQAFLDLLVESVATARLLLLVNYRPEYHHGWGSKTYYTQLRLDPLGRAEAGELLAALLGAGAAAGLGRLQGVILDKTEGNPFFIEEVVQTLAEEGVLRGERGSYRVEKVPAELHIPVTVQGLLTSRIDRLPAAEKELLQLLAVIGKEFRFGLVQRVADHPEEEVHGLLAGLQAREFIYEQPAFPEPEYTFKHALTQEVAYGSVLGARRRVLHGRTAQAIEEVFRYNLDTQYAELARHYSRTDNAAKAVEYLRLAGTQAVERGAYEEAVAQLSRGLELLPELPEGAEHEQQELLLQLALGWALLITKGVTAPEVEHVYGRAAELCTRGAAGPQLWRALAGLCAFYTVRADLQRARGLAEQLLESARPSGDAWGVFIGHYIVGITLFWQGELSAAREHLQQAFDLGGQLRQRLSALPYEAVERLVLSRAYRAHVLYQLGYPDQALRASRESVALAREIGRPFALTTALLHDGALHQFRGDVEVVRERAEALIALATEHGFYQYVMSGLLLRGCAFAAGGQIEAGIKELRGALDLLRGAGSEMGRPHFSGVLAEAYGKAGQPAQGLAVLEEAVECMNRTGQRLLEAELQRIKGDLLLAVSRDKEAEAEDCFRHAIDCARRQGAKSWQLRGALSLSRLWREQGKHEDARKLLAEIYGWFTEGFDTVDLKEAKTLLEELR
jgi:class 3 adenylate cyclase/predicted ATPase